MRPLASREVWIDLNMRMARETCLLFPERSRFVVPYYGHVGHMTADYRRRWDSFNVELGRGSSMASCQWL
ncbi:hypothetical protein AMTR_s00100p00153130 [Amborella trichopoda]|uniref:Uncharacterized protein n=1 Tax=Amborella trichopoda TaxID=13333 RepID=W1P0J1_AMBTC|nr:hypothetical protein AMTR_s00100p00153130 [Amborella trichopoda]